MAEAEPGRLIAGGRSADVYEAGDGRVLRRYRDRRPADRVARDHDQCNSFSKGRVTFL